MKRILCLCLALVLLGVGCTSPDKKEEKTIRVFAAASLTEALTELGRLYEADHAGVRVVFSFGSSGLLKTQIEEGAPCDLFLSASPEEADALAASGHIAPAGIVELLENRVVLCLADNSDCGAADFDSLISALREGTVLLAIGGSDVPVGRYARRIFAAYGLDEASVSGCLTCCSDVKEVTTAVREGTVDCGILYATDARTAGLTPADTASEALCGRVVYPAAVLKDSSLPDEAADFLRFLTEETASNVFSDYGFTPVGNR